MCVEMGQQGAASHRNTVSARASGRYSFGRSVAGPGIALGQGGDVAGPPFRPVTDNRGGEIGCCPPTFTE
jgi:hypothetical protein